MKKLMAATALAAFLAVPALAAPEVKFYTEHGEWRASTLIDTKVTNAAGETIGDINDVLIDKDGKVAAVVLGVGGFLGVGERHAAVTFSSLQLTRDANGNPLVRVDVTKDQLKAQPEWKWEPATRK
jgi:sporulation protein YlmC with PRC-barrel domain